MNYWYLVIAIWILLASLHGHGNSLPTSLVSPLRNAMSPDHETIVTRYRQTSRNRRSRRSDTKKEKFLRRAIRQLTVEDVYDILREKRRIGSESGRWYGSTPHSANRRPPKLECPRASDGRHLFSCPSPEQNGSYRCIDDHALCDKRQHCPGGEDEEPTLCMFHTVTMNNFNILMEAIFGLKESVLGL